MIRVGIAIYVQDLWSLWNQFPPTGESVCPNKSVRLRMALLAAGARMEVRDISSGLGDGWADQLDATGNHCDSR